MESVFSPYTNTEQLINPFVLNNFSEVSDVLNNTVNVKVEQCVNK